MTDTEPDTRCGFVALIGAPNAGKSTLLNALVGTKVSIVSRKVQTTRSLVRGIGMYERDQIIFVDTPGIFAPKRRLDRAMVKSAWGGAGDADVVALLVDVKRGHCDEVDSILEHLSEVKRRKVLILNKVDLVEKGVLLKLATEIHAKASFEETFMVSALKGSGVTDVLKGFGTREKIFERLHDELPYQITVETDQWKEQKDGSARVEQTVFVTRDSHKKIVIGDQGQMLKSIGTAARKDIMEAADCKVHLFLFVKVRENWVDDPERYREMGLEFPRD